MAGRGPAPKDPNRRARRNLEPVPTRIIETSPDAQPPLPANIKWPQRTREWWAMWGDSPLSADFTANDWSELLDTAVLHAAYWSGKLSVAGELRLRVAKFGATPEDRARLRWQFAMASTAELDADRKKAPSARDRRGPLLRAVPDGE